MKKLLIGSSLWAGVMLLPSMVWAQERLEVDFESFRNLCSVSFSPRIELADEQVIVGYQWDFGDGYSSSDRNPVHTYSGKGNFHVTLTVDYKVGDLSETFTSEKRQRVRFKDNGKISFTEKEIQFTTYRAEGVIHAEVSTFSDINGATATVSQSNGYLNGSRGVWRPNASYRYLAPRESEGTYSLENFDWNRALLYTPTQWVRTDHITKFSPGGNFLEKENSSGLFSAALISKDGKTMANGINMKHEEMAFTSFEKNATSTGNWVLGMEPVVLKREFPVVSGDHNLLIVEASSEELNGITQVDVFSQVLEEATTTNYVSGSKVLCQQMFEKDPTKAVMVLDKAPHQASWLGKVQVTTTVEPQVSGTTIDDHVSHTGQASLRVNQTSFIEQPLLRLSAGKEYVVNVWVSTAVSRKENRFLASNQKLEIVLTQGDGVEKRFTYQADGPVIEGWQQIKGNFVTPEEKLVSLKLGVQGSASQPVWYDDLRLFPSEGNMESYVYDKVHGKVEAILDANNYASYNFYDESGEIYLRKAETIDGIKTISETIRFTQAN